MFFFFNFEDHTDYLRLLADHGTDHTDHPLPVAPKTTAGEEGTECARDT